MCLVPSDSTSDGFIKAEWLRERCVMESGIKYSCGKNACVLKIFMHDFDIKNRTRQQGMSIVLRNK